MGKLGIIAAMKEESDAVKAKMTNITEIKIYGITFIVGEINNKECVLVQSGVGKVNAARTTQLMIDTYKDIEAIVNVGSAGALNYELGYGDIVLSTACVQHDFDVTCFNYPRGYIMGIGVLIEADNKLIETFEKAIGKVKNENKIVKGIIATGDQFYNDPVIKEELRKEFNAECDDMEGAAIAQVCMLCSIPFIIIRSISDKPKNKEKVDFYEYLEMASKRCADFLSIAVEEI